MAKESSRQRELEKERDLAERQAEFLVISEPFVKVGTKDNESVLGRKQDCCLHQLYCSMNSMCIDYLILESFPLSSAGGDAAGFIASLLRGSVLREARARAGVVFGEWSLQCTIV